jgi:hypothetical protein
VSLHYDFGTKPQVDWSNYRKDKMKLFLIAFLLVPIMVFDLSEKLSILFFYNIDKSYKSAEIYNVQIKGFLILDVEDDNILGLVLRKLMINIKILY